MIFRYIFIILIVLGANNVIWSQKTNSNSNQNSPRKRLPKPDSPNSSTSSPKTETFLQEVQIWQEGRFEVIDGKQYWSPPQWVLKKVELPKDKTFQYPTGKPDAYYRVDSCTNATQNNTAFSQSLKTLKLHSSEVKRFEVTQKFVQNNCLSVAQVQQLMLIFETDNLRLEMAKYCYGFCYEKKQYLDVFESLQYTSNEEKLKQYLIQKGFKESPKSNNSTPQNKNSGNENKAKENSDNHSNHHLDEHNHKCQNPMLPTRQFNILINSIKSANSESSREAIADQGLNGYCATTEQVKEILQNFSSEAKTLELAKRYYSNTYNPEEYLLILELFRSDYSKEDLAKYLKKMNKG